MHVNPQNPRFLLNNNEHACADLNSVSVILLLSFNSYYPSEPFFGLNKISPKVLLKVLFIMSPVINILNICIYVFQSK